jgi:hypothetical protein
MMGVSILLSVLSILVVAEAVALFLIRRDYENRLKGLTDIIKARNHDYKLLENEYHCLGKAFDQLKFAPLSSKLQPKKPSKGVPGKVETSAG